MKKITPELLAEMGVPLMSLNSQFDAADNSDVSDKSRGSGSTGSLTSQAMHSEASVSKHKQVADEEGSDALLSNLTEKSDVFDESHQVYVLSRYDVKWFQSDNEPLVKLWRNISEAFELDASEISFVNATLFTSEEACIVLLDQLMATSHVSILNFGQEGTLLELLNEGFEVIQLPELEEVFESPVVKKQLFLQMSAA